MNQSQYSETIPIRKGEEFNQETLRSFLNEHVDGFPNKPLEVKQYPTGVSNLTYFIRSGEWEAVMRRPPSGPLPPKAHDMKRESDLLTKLHPVFPLVPKPYVYCNDPEVLGEPFYVMERKHGVVLDYKFPAGFTASKELCKEISYAVVDALAQLHSVDYEKADLANFGHPNGFLERQVNGWIHRYIKFKTDEIPYFEPMAKWLVDHIPSSQYASIIHNDYKLNNMLLSKEFKQIEAILDWEMATIADPFFDLACALGYWMEEEDPDYLKDSLPTVTTLPGFIKRKDFIQRYAVKTGKDIPSLTFYMVFTYFKLAVVLQQIYYRWKVGQTKDERFETFIKKVKNLMYYAYEVSETGNY
ncbi:phosphotransferase family protein [Bacillus sp. EB600]|uniref:phosphotransferase family protein n=1 Tax=Bacillus sp. EB600 TaxID=2806345 RepID=UPI00210CE0E0|nr:phosphotransferase family protein [Bacillus sp. EB600]MCQ6279543.1 phosphotransferase family protein [Bacillus sp. EB600]